MYSDWEKAASSELNEHVGVIVNLPIEIKLSGNNPEQGRHTHL
jgi:hypothetical protein